MAVKKKKYDFGKRVIDYIFIMMFSHFVFMCFMAYELKNTEIFIEYTHDMKWVFLTVLGLTIWKEKFIMIIKTAAKYGLKPKNFSEYLKAVPKSEELPNENSECDNIYGGDCTENIESEDLPNG